MIRLSHDKIPANRFLIYLLVACWIPFILILLFFLHQRSELNHIQMRLGMYETQLTSKLQLQRKNLSIYEKFRGFDPRYIDQRLESLSFLKGEVLSLQNLLKADNLLDPQPLQTRLSFLLGSENKLAFRESSVETTPRFREIQETLLHPVEIDALDLKQVLTLIEGPPLFEQEAVLGRPQMLITDFRIERKSSKQNVETYSLDLKLLKREFL